MGTPPPAHRAHSLRTTKEAAGDRSRIVHGDGRGGRLLTGRWRHAACAPRWSNAKNRHCSHSQRQARLDVNRACKARVNKVPRRGGDKHHPHLRSPYHPPPKSLLSRLFRKDTAAQPVPSTTTRVLRLPPAGAPNCAAAGGSSPPAGSIWESVEVVSCCRQTATTHAGWLLPHCIWHANTALAHTRPHTHLERPCTARTRGARHRRRRRHPRRQPGRQPARRPSAGAPPRRPPPRQRPRQWSTRQPARKKLQRCWNRLGLPLRRPAAAAGPPGRRRGALVRFTNAAEGWRRAAAASPQAPDQVKRTTSRAFRRPAKGRLERQPSLRRRCLRRVGLQSKGTGSLRCRTSAVDPWQLRTPDE